ncbi:MAG: hypothetical protein KY445_04370 [Armatimonadetes bacterium]|nr:hypothetical protein [Armatimonadota bacterium]
MALLDAILQPEWQYRYYSFNVHWNEGEEMASMRDGAGNDYFLLFSNAGAILKGFDHESPMSPYASDPPRIWPGILERVPAVFASFLAEPAFALEATTFCIWRTSSDQKWQVGDIEFPDGDDPDGSASILTLLDGNPQNYCDWATENYEVKVNLKAVEDIFAHRPITPQIVGSLNAGLDLEDLTDDLREIGYRI